MAAKALARPFHPLAGLEAEIADKKGRVADLELRAHACAGTDLGMAAALEKAAAALQPEIKKLQERRARSLAGLPSPDEVEDRRVNAASPAPAAPTERPKVPTYKSAPSETWNAMVKAAAPGDKLKRWDAQRKDVRWILANLQNLHAERGEHAVSYQQKTHSAFLDMFAGLHGERDEHAAILRQIDERLAKLECATKAAGALAYRGVYVDGAAYAPGQFVTSAGSLWHCNAPTWDKPGESSAAWTLAVKRGRDGRDAKERGK